jgi:hypothetical protein
MSRTKHGRGTKADPFNEESQEIQSQAEPGAAPDWPRELIFAAHWLLV